MVPKSGSWLHGVNSCAQREGVFLILLLRRSTSPAPPGVVPFEETGDLSAERLALWVCQALEEPKAEKKAGGCDSESTGWQDGLQRCRGRSLDGIEGRLGGSSGGQTAYGQAALQTSSCRIKVLSPRCYSVCLHISTYMYSR